MRYAVALLFAVGCSHALPTKPQAPPAAPNAPAPTPPVATAAEESPPVMAREGFRADVIDSTPEQVIKYVGWPTATSETGALPEFGEKRLTAVWYYRNRTKDLTTGTVDAEARVYFYSYPGQFSDMRALRVEFVGR